MIRYTDISLSRTSMIAAFPTLKSVDKRLSCVSSYIDANSFLLHNIHHDHNFVLHCMEILIWTRITHTTHGIAIQETSLHEVCTEANQTMHFAAAHRTEHNFDHISCRGNYDTCPTFRLLWMYTRYINQDRQIVPRWTGLNFLTYDLTIDARQSTAESKSPCSHESSSLVTEWSFVA